MSMSQEISQLADLRQRGVLSEDEFARAKERVLQGQAAAPAGSGSARAGGVVDAVNQLQRSVTDSWLGGVCGGLAASTGLAAWAWRLGFVLMTMFGGAGVLAYVLLWIFVPPAPQPYRVAPPNPMGSAG